MDDLENDLNSCFDRFSRAALERLWNFCRFTCRFALLLCLGTFGIHSGLLNNKILFLSVNILLTLHLQQRPNMAPRKQSPDSSPPPSPSALLNTKLLIVKQDAKAKSKKKPKKNTVVKKEKAVKKTPAVCMDDSEVKVVVDGSKDSVK